jgi:hypothetical protein
MLPKELTVFFIKDVVIAGLVTQLLLSKGAAKIIKDWR